MFSLLLLYIIFKPFRSLCDINQHGKLDMEQFSLAMWLVERKLLGIDPPTILTPEMIPPNNRTVTPSTAVHVSIGHLYHYLTVKKKKYYSSINIVKNMQLLYL